MGGIGGGTLNSQIVISDRPVTQQGLGGIGTGVKGEWGILDEQGGSDRIKA